MGERSEEGAVHSGWGPGRSKALGRLPLPLQPHLQLPPPLQPHQATQSPGTTMFFPTSRPLPLLSPLLLLKCPFLSST